MTIQRGKMLCCWLPLDTNYQSSESLKKFKLTECQLHANQDCILKRINEMKSFKKVFSMKSETDDGLSSCSNFPERSTDIDLEVNKPAHLR